MTFSIDVTHPGGCPWPIYPATAEVGHRVTAIDAVSQGLVVQTATTEASFDESQITGPDSRWLNVELPVATPADSDQVNYYGVVTTLDAVEAGGKTNIVYGPCTVLAQCIDGVETEWKVGMPLTVNASGQLVKPGATGEQGKIVAVIAQETTVTTPGAAQLVWVDFHGIMSVGTVARTT